MITDIRANFYPEWTKSIFHVVFAPPKSSTDIETTADGTAGADGADGHNGNKTTQAGPGQDGSDGIASDALDNKGQALVFSTHKPIGVWQESSTTGNGGTGGSGGDAGAFVPNLDHGPWPDGGNGGAGAASAGAESELIGHKILGFTGDGTQNGITLSVFAESGDAGNGGNGGNGDGETGPVHEPGGDGGDGASGGDAGNADVVLENEIFRPLKSSDTDHFFVTLHLGTNGGVGGNGGSGGLGGAGSVAGTDGIGGLGGNGGNVNISIQHDIFHLAAKAGSTTTLSITALAFGGNGGSGGSTIGNPGENSAGGGHGGNASVEITSTQILGGAENDIVFIALEAEPGRGGPSGNGISTGTDGFTSIGFVSDTFDGGGGVNTLALSNKFSGTDGSATINLAAGTFSVGGGANTIAHFENVTGAFGDDTIIGDSKANVLAGGYGADFLRGGGGHDVFAYSFPAESESTQYDTIVDMDFGADKISSPFAVGNIGKEITGATIHTGSFDADMAAAVNTNHLHANGAVLVSGQLDGNATVFLVINANGVAGYQEGDLVIDVANSVGKLTVHSFVTPA